MKKLTMIGLSLLALAAIGCSNTGSGNNASQYSLAANGTCVMTTTGQVVATNNCNTSATSQACYGPYYFYNGSTWMEGICSGSNCSGFNLYNTAGQPVHCL